jgi:2-amino-4-hydroxy-6-hydroxymethyldihydropteridine diphosphokinase
MPEAILALGSNLGDRAGNLQRAIDYLASRSARATRVSSVWETPPVPADQPAFYNAVAAVETALAPEDLLAAAKDVEHALGRRPSRHWGPRPVDIDILFMGETVLATERLTIPHPRIAERLFVLVPLSEVLRGPLPVLGQTALDRAAALPPGPLLRTPFALRLP